MTKTYKTFENADCAIVTTQLGPREFMATTREFKAFGKSEPAALNTLAEMLRAAAGSIGVLAIQRENEIHEDLQREVNPDCAWVSVSGCSPCVRESAVGQKCVSCRKFFGTPLKDEQQSESLRK